MRRQALWRAIKDAKLRARTKRALQDVSSDRPTFKELSKIMKKLDRASVKASSSEGEREDDDPSSLEEALTLARSSIFMIFESALKVGLSDETS